MNRKYVFWFHYNKPESTKSGTPKVTLHYRKACYIVDNIIINVSTRGCTQKIQPRFVIKGLSSDVRIVDNIAYIN